MNKILRKSKAFFLRRRFADDPIYRTIFVEYIKVIISFQRAPVEFFIEGTRSRTGKSLPPKFGKNRITYRTIFILNKTTAEPK